MSRRDPRLTLLAIVASLCVALASCGTAAGAPADATTTRAAGWITRTLAANGHVMPSSSDSWGLTIDSVVLLAASGTGGDELGLVADRLAAEAPAAYVATSPAGDQGRRAKLAYALLVAGRDATPLLADLRASIGGDGRFGTSTNVFGQAYAVLALARTAEGVPPEAVARLRAYQCSTPSDAQRGGFGYGSCFTVDGDATGIVVSALLAAGVPASDPALVASVDWMQRRQLADGSFSMQLASTKGNANSSGLVGYAARQLGTPASIAIANAAATYVRTLQVTCTSPRIAGSEPTGGGFPASWDGAIAYDSDTQDAAIESGVPSGQMTNWRYATLQGALAFAGVPAMSQLTATGLRASPDPITACTATPVVGPGGDGSSGNERPAKVLGVRSALRPVPTGGRVTVDVTGLDTGEAYAVVLSGRVLARGEATGSLVRRIVVVPSALGTDPRRILRVVGSSASRTGSTTLATVAPRALVVRATPARVRVGTLVRVTVGGLVAREAYTVRVRGAVVRRGFVAASGRVSLLVRQAAPVGARRIVVCGATCRRTGGATVVVGR